MLPGNLFFPEMKEMLGKQISLAFHPAEGYNLVHQTQADQDE